MSNKARGYVFNNEAGLHLMRSNTECARMKTDGSGPEWVKPKQMCYADITYEKDKNDHQLYDEDGNKKIKEKKWTPFLHNVPLTGEIISGGIGNSSAYYSNLGLGDLVSHTVNLNPPVLIANKGYDMEMVWNTPGSVKLRFHRPEDTSSTIRNISFNLILVVPTNDGLINIGGGASIGQNQTFTITVDRNKLSWCMMVWYGASNGFNSGWQVPIIGYDIIF